MNGNRYLVTILDRREWVNSLDDAIKQLLSFRKHWGEWNSADIYDDHTGEIVLALPAIERQEDYGTTKTK